MTSPCSNLVILAAVLGRNLIKTGEKMLPILGAKTIGAVNALCTRAMLEAVELISSQQDKFALAATGDINRTAKGGLDDFARFVAKFGQ